MNNRDQFAASDANDISSKCLKRVSCFGVRLNRPRISKMLNACCLGVVLSLLTACGTALGSVDERARGFNEETADYANVASLLNIVRASQNEPLNFVAVTGNTGHDTLTASLGLPNVSFFVGPDKPAVNHLTGFSTTRTAVGGSVSNDFQFSVVDDPASQAALLRPIDPATLSFFMNQGYDRELLFLLFVEQVDIYDSSFRHPNIRSNVLLKSGKDTQPGDINLDGYVTLMNYIYKSGLTAVTDQGFVPTATGTPAGYFCFDNKLASPPAPPPLVDLKLFSSPPLDRNLVTPPKNFDFGCYPSPKKIPDPNADPKKAAVGGAQGSPQSAGITVPMHELTCFAPSDKDKARGVPSPYPANPWTFCDPTGRIIIIHTRSLQGAYRYLGELLNIRDWRSDKYPQPPANNIPPLLATDKYNDEHLSMLNIVVNSQVPCFTKVEYKARTWCLPDDANTTKRVIALLHQIFELFTKPSNEQTTPTVRVTG